MSRHSKRATEASPEPVAGPVRGHPRVVLVRPWVDARGGAGCCSGDSGDPVCLDHRVGGHAAHAPQVVSTAEAYRALRVHCPQADVQVVGAGNTAYLLPTTYRAVRRRAGVLTALRAAARAPRAGAVLVDGEDVGDVEVLGAAGVVAAVRARC